jgi:hypothetical protein
VMTPLTRAIVLAAQAHDGQVDKQGQPYILHPLRVADQFRSTRTAVVVAVLHDVVEDTDVTIDVIRKEFGDEVADAVDSLTKRDQETYAGFIKRCCRNELAKWVKYYDILDHLSRMDSLSEPDKTRLREKYGKAVGIILDEREATS